IKHEVDPFAACQFCSWHEIGVSGEQDDLVHLMLESQRRYVDTYPHIHTFLPHCRQKIILQEIFDFY
ncbi:hypothetical protein BXO559_07275, partial [Xanthomonas oryzae pv. oryzae]